MSAAELRVLKGVHGTNKVHWLGATRPQARALQCSLFAVNAILQCLIKQRCSAVILLPCRESQSCLGAITWCQPRRRFSGYKMQRNKLSWSARSGLAAASLCTSHPSPPVHKAATFFFALPAIILALLHCLLLCSSPCS